MNQAPLFALRSLFANGGAPGAFVRRDAQLTETLEHIVRSAQTAEQLGRADAFAGLLEQIDLASLLRSAGATTDSADETDATPAVRARSRNPDTPGAREIAQAEARAQRNPDNTITAALRRTADLIGKGISEPVARAAVDARSPEQRAGAFGHTITDALKSVAHDLAQGSLDATAEQQARAKHASVSPERAAASRDVGVIGGRHSTDEAAGIATILASVGQAVIRQVVEGGATPSEATSPDRAKSVMSPLARAVQRVEQQLREQQAVSPSRSARNQQLDESASPRQRAFEADPVRTPSRQSFITNVGDASASAPRAVGLRGLVERAGPVRAAFFGATAEYVDQTWPNTDFDHMSTLLDDAARREGVDLEEGV